MQFESHLDPQAMRRRLRKKIRDIDWKLGDSEYEGFYVLGRTEDGIRIKITDESAGWNALPPDQDEMPRRYHLGIFFFAVTKDLGRDRETAETEVLQRRIVRALSTSKTA